MQPDQGQGPLNSFSEVSGLRRSRQPFKIAGVMMGSTENLAMCNDELASVFARRRRRRSATPVKIGGITMGDENITSDSEDGGVSASNAPFGATYATGSLPRRNKRSSYHSGMRSSNLGMWGQRIFVNSQNGEDEQQQPQKKAHNNHALQNGQASASGKVAAADKATFNKQSEEDATAKELGDVKQFLTDMHSEINAMTTSAYSLVEQSMTTSSMSKVEHAEQHNGYCNNKGDSGGLTCNNSHYTEKSECSEIFSKTSTQQQHTTNKSTEHFVPTPFCNSSNNSTLDRTHSHAPSALLKVDTPLMSQANSKRRPEQTVSATPDDLPKLAPVMMAKGQEATEEDEMDRLERCSTVSVEETIVIGAAQNRTHTKERMKVKEKAKKDEKKQVGQENSGHLGNIDDDNEVIEVNPDQVKYHSGETPHPNRFETEQIFTVMSEANSEDEEIVEVTPGEVHYHDAIAKQMGLLVPPKVANNPRRGCQKIALASSCNNLGLYRAPQKKGQSSSTLEGRRPRQDP